MSTKSQQQQQENNENGMELDVTAVLGRDSAADKENKPARKAEKKTISLVNNASWLEAERREHEQTRSTIHTAHDNLVTLLETRAADQIAAAVVHLLHPRITALEENVQEILGKISGIEERLEKVENALEDSSGEEESGDGDEEEVASIGEDGENQANEPDLLPPAAEQRQDVPPPPEQRGRDQGERRQPVEDQRQHRNQHHYQQQRNNYGRNNGPNQQQRNFGRGNGRRLNGFFYMYRQWERDQERQNNRRRWEPYVPRANDRRDGRRY